MILTTTRRLGGLARLWGLRRGLPQYRFAQDFSYVYDGIANFEDNLGLGEDLMLIRGQALEFAKQKLAPHAAEW